MAPARQKPLPPPEIVFLIIQDVTSIDLHSLAMTCRHFHQICLPIYLLQHDIDISNDSLWLQPSSFGAPLHSMSLSWLFLGAEFKMVTCYFPEWNVLHTSPLEDMRIFKQFLLKLRSVSRLLLCFRLISTSELSSSSMINYFKWQTALGDLLDVAGTRSPSLYIRWDGQHNGHTGYNSAASNLLLRLYLRSSRRLITVDSLDVSAPPPFSQFSLSNLFTAPSITSLVLSNYSAWTSGALQGIYLPNLRHFDVQGYKSHPILPLHAFLLRHSPLLSLTIDLCLRPSLKDEAPFTNDMLPCLTTLSGDVASVLWMLDSDQALPDLTSITLSSPFVEDRYDRDIRYHQAVWVKLASRKRPTLSSLTIRDAQIITRLLGVEKSGWVVDAPLPSIESLTLESGRLDWPTHSNGDSSPPDALRAAAMRSLPGWLAKLFPNLKNLNIEHLKLPTTGALRDVLLVNMKNLCPGVTLCDTPRQQRLASIRSK
ncbi:hypothetical protein EYR38_001598 [Pleurotus pulmonarius]|nr:hypothetical protein EYR38_001598 [Pleurotus pulmonarius]